MWTQNLGHSVRGTVPSVLFDHMRQFDYVFTLLVFLAGVECLLLKQKTKKFIKILYILTLLWLTLGMQIWKLLKNTKNKLIFGPVALYTWNSH